MTEMFGEAWSPMSVPDLGIRMPGFKEITFSNNDICDFPSDLAHKTPYLMRTFHTMCTLLRIRNRITGLNSKFDLFFKVVPKC